MLRFTKFAVTAAIAIILPASYASSAPIPYSTLTAPDVASRNILKTHYISFQDGAAGPNDVRAAIDRNFADVIEHNLAVMPERTARMWLDQMSDRELADLAQLYTNSNAMTFRTGHALEVLAVRLDVNRLARLPKFFGTSEVTRAVLAAAPTKYSALTAVSGPDVHAAPLAGAPVTYPVAMQGSLSGSTVRPMQTAPTVDMTLNEVYLNFRTLPVGSLSVQSSIYETAQFAGKNLVYAWGVGYGFGTGITYLMQTYAPSWYYGSFVDVVGGTPYNAIDFVQNLVLNTFNLYSAGLTNQLGNYQAGSVGTMGAAGAAPAMIDTGGDLGMEYEFEAFENATGGGKICVGGTCAPIEQK